MQEYNSALILRNQSGVEELHYPYTKWENVLDKEIDAQLSETSQNPVQSSAVANALRGKADLDASGKVKAEQLPPLDYLPSSEKGAAGGVASLDETGKVPLSQLPPISSGGGFVAQNEEPTDTSLLWIDTGNGNILKFHNGTVWASVAAVWG